MQLAVGSGTSLSDAGHPAGFPFRGAVALAALVSFAPTMPGTRDAEDGTHTAATATARA